MLTFSAALQALKQGHRLTREVWRNAGQYVFLVPASTFRVNREPLMSMLGEGTAVTYHAHIDMRTSAGYVTPWLPSQADLLDDGWEIVPPSKPGDPKDSTQG